MPQPSAERAVRDQSVATAAGAPGGAPAGTPRDPAGSEHVMSSNAWCAVSARGRGRRFQVVQFLRLGGGHQADLDEVEWADEAVTEPEPTGAHDGVAQRYGPVMLEQDDCGGGVVRDVLQDVPGRFVPRQDVHPLTGRLSTRLGACNHAFFTLETQADE